MDLAVIVLLHVNLSTQAFLVVFGLVAMSLVTSNRSSLPSTTT